MRQDAAHAERVNRPRYGKGGPMRKIAIINQKGGVGKTTTTANLGAALARAGRRVLLLDFDPQGHLTLHFGIRLGDDQANSYDVLTDDVPIAEASIVVNDRLTLVPADINLAGAESELVSVTGREVLLKEALVAIEDRYDYLLIDCPPSVGVLTVNALSAADELLIPLQTQFFALQGFGKLLEKTVTLVQRRINPGLLVRGVILCMHEAATRLACEVVEDLRTFLDAGRSLDVAWAKAKVFDTHIRRNIKLAEACSFGQSIFDYAPKSNGAMDYLRLAAEIFPEAGIELPHWMVRGGQAHTVRGNKASVAGAKSVAATPSSNPSPAVRAVSDRFHDATSQLPADGASTGPAQVPRIVRVIDARALSQSMGLPTKNGEGAAKDAAHAPSEPAAEAAPPNPTGLVPGASESAPAQSPAPARGEDKEIGRPPNADIASGAAPAVRSAME